MAKLSRTKELWHIPKRGSVHQTVYLVHILMNDKFNGKTWSRTTQESLATEMRKAGITRNENALSHQAVRTLLANMPKYLGFIYIDESTTSHKLIVTEVGHELAAHHDVGSIKFEKKLSAYKAKNSLIKTSPIFRNQLLKLIISNPIILKDCENILVFPFRFTLKLLLELNYLDIEEIAYILFQVKSEDEFQCIVQRIKNFRTLTPINRTEEINAYKKTPEGNLTLTKAPSAGYYMSLCESTEICKKTKATVNKTSKQNLRAIRLVDRKAVEEILEKFHNVKIFNFTDNLVLWKEYYTKPNRILPPITITFRLKSTEECLISIKNGTHDERGIISNKTDFICPVFPNEDYMVDVFTYSSTKPSLQTKVRFSETDEHLDLKIKKSTAVIRTKEIIVEAITEFFSGQYDGFDKNYRDKLKVLQTIEKKNYLSPPSPPKLGGRLEFLFFELLKQLEGEGVIDKVIWYGRTDKFALATPAPGGKQGNPDITFEIDDYLFVVELTSIRAVRMQWSGSEASSVPDHIASKKQECPLKKVIGIFSAPEIHPQLEQNLTLNAREDNVGMIFEPCVDFAKFLSQTDRSTLKNRLIEKSNKQLSK